MAKEAFEGRNCIPKAFRKPFFFMYHIMLQTLFVLTMWWASTAWFVSMAPFIDPSTIGAPHSFIWPEPPAMFTSWIISDNATAANASTIINTTSINVSSTNTPLYDWAFCNVSSKGPAFLPVNATQNDLIAFTGQYVRHTLSNDVCVTGIAAYLYLVFIYAGIALVFFHLGVVVVWPLIPEKFKPTMVPYENDFIKMVKNLMIKAFQCCRKGGNRVVITEDAELSRF